MNGNPFVVVINNIRLTEAQTMTLHCALSSLVEDMNEKGALGDDEHGEFMRKSYLKRADEIFELYMR